MKTTTFSKNILIIFGYFITILLFSDSVLARRKNKGNQQTTNNSNSDQTFREDQCFCGVRYEHTKKLNLYLFGPGAAAEIVNYVDQSISKFNAMGLVSENAIIEDRNTSKNPYALEKQDVLTKVITHNTKNHGLMMNAENKNPLRITYLKSIMFSTDESKNKIISLNFMMGRAVNFKIEIKFTDLVKKQFDIKFVQIPYIHGNPEKTQELIRKNTKGYELKRSLSHFDKNQMEVDVCRMLYSALNQISIREFNVSISSNIVKYQKGKKSFQKAIGCSKNVLFRKRFSDEYITQVVQRNYKKVETNLGRVFKEKLVYDGVKDFYAVNQIPDEENMELKRKISETEVERLGDESELESEVIVSEHQELDRGVSSQSNNSIIDFDQDSHLNNSELNSRSSSSKIHQKKSSEQTSNLSSSEIDQELKTNQKLNESSIHTDSFQTGQNSDYNSTKQTHNPFKRQDGLSPENKSNSKDEMMNNIKIDILKRINKIQNDQQIEIDNQKKTKRKRVIVLIESIECNKCANDINTEVFLKLLNNKSYMI